MKKILFLLFLLPLMLTAQKAPDANKAVVNLIAYDEKGDVLHSAYGYFSSPDGEIIAPFHAFKGAVRAEIVDAAGRRAVVRRILGASSLYDVVRASTDIPTKKLPFLSPCPTPGIIGQSDIWQTFYTNNKKEKPLATSVVAVDAFDSYAYYTISTPNEERFVGCPVVNGEGKVIGLMQKNITKNALTACAVDIRTADSLAVTTAAVFNSDLNDIKIPKQIPVASEAEAFSYLYMVLRSATDSVLKTTAVSDFMAAYPDNTDIYGEMANYHAARNRFSAADSTLRKGIARGGDFVADLYLLQSELMQGKVERMGTEVYPSWNLETALAAAEKAYSLQPRPRYLLQQGTVLYALQRFKEAHEKFSLVNRSPLANSRSFLYAAMALESDSGDVASIVTLLDSAVVHCPKPYTQEVLVPLFKRAKLLASMGDFRKAAADLTEYEKVAGVDNLNAYFYFWRSEIEKNGRMFQQALDDLTTAVSVAKTLQDKETYLTEKAFLYLQVNLPDEAVATAREVLKLNAESADAHKIIGVAMVEKKQKRKALEHFKKAQALGDENAAELIAKYKLR